MIRSLLTRPMAFAVATLTVLGVGLPAFAARPVPFQGRADLVITSPQPLTAFAKGNATHLGRFTRTETIVVNPNDGTFTATLVFTAANGDRLHAEAAGHFTSPNGDSAEGTYLFTGGTGRFKNASGQAAFEIKPDQVGFDVTFKGTIQY
jgi:hypothetical protein